MQALQAADTEYSENSQIETPGKITNKDYAFYQEFFKDYQPNQDLVNEPYPVKDLDFISGVAYSVYNWELFFHVPITVAIHLSKNQRFEEAQRWFHYIFDPTDDSDGPTPERFWKVKPFQTTDVKSIQKILTNLSSEVDPELLKATVNSINAWKDNPFRPHTVARYRQTAYMLKTVMAYLDNLIDWGDSLFQQDTIESINEATQVYVMAANILGPRPQAIPKKGTIKKQTYAQLKKDNLDAMGNALRQLEANMVFDLMPFPTEVTDNPQQKTLNSIGKTLYFSIPQNEKLLEYWDTVADRLYKIRNSLNLQGAFRQLPLFQPPIDPALLAQAAASGLNVSAVVGGLNQPLPLVRFQLLVQKATEICQEVKTLGNSLLSAIEKEDNEALSLLRSRHEQIILELTESLKYAQWQEAITSRKSLQNSLAIAVQRYSYYELQLGKKEQDIKSSIPTLENIDIDFESLGNMNFSTTDESVKTRKVSVDIAKSTSADIAQIFSGGKLLSPHEVRETFLLESAQIASDTANILNIASSAAHYVPQFEINIQPMGMGSSSVYGGKTIGDAVGATAAAARAIADRLNFEARRANRIDAFTRREIEWTFQSNLAAHEITQIYKQYQAAQIREFIAKQDYENHQKQIQNAKEIEHFLKGESTSIHDLEGYEQRKITGEMGVSSASGPP
ncbi:hypothetical protein [Adonisia turfae]|uniref:hypothetical protein n=1 Tax=Adonisia turfae TaxID=2950184 RepID=UPI0013D4CBED|nr:hypothetical protein [Adonisia turfae]